MLFLSEGAQLLSLLEHVLWSKRQPRYQFQTLLGVYPKGSPAIGPISATPSKTWWALLHVFLTRRSVPLLSWTHLTPQLACVSSCCIESPGQRQTQDLRSLIQWFHTTPFPHSTSPSSVSPFLYHQTNFQDLSAHSVYHEEDIIYTQIPITQVVTYVPLILDVAEESLQRVCSFTKLTL